MSELGFRILLIRSQLNPKPNIRNSKALLSTFKKQTIAKNPK